MDALFKTIDILSIVCSFALRVLLNIKTATFLGLQFLYFRNIIVGVESFMATKIDL
ncbi:hypothetical protein [Flavobacterium salmonis]|uniref:Uncharacterized protein n=1 Tax=Flavobacterium salmonis TaxID=2654844 RepID=A0A6V6Z5K6_9FLAO|nr:hypothetical protein [Flavobacterium salmonis]CAD0006859.1 hypothetical protein FLAT13_03539 [Flavobacterium salmonis]